MCFHDHQINLTHIHGALCNNWWKRIFICKNRMTFAMFSVRVFPSSLSQYNNDHSRVWPAYVYSLKIVKRFVRILPSLLLTNLNRPMLSFKNQVNLFELIKSHQVHCFRNLTLPQKTAQLGPVICLCLIRILIYQFFSWFTTIKLKIDIFRFN